MSPAAKQFLAFAHFIVNHPDFEKKHTELSAHFTEAWHALKDVSVSAEAAGLALCKVDFLKKKGLTATDLPKDILWSVQLGAAISVAIAFHMQGLIPAAARDEAMPGALVVPIPTAEVRAHVDAQLASDSALMGVNSVVRGTDIVRMPPPDAMAVKVATLGATTKLLNETGWHVEPPGPMDPDDPSRPE